MPRTSLRKHVHTLRTAGQVPGVVYGHGIAAAPVSVPLKDFQRAIHRAGKTQLVDLEIEGEDNPRKVLIREVQYGPRQGAVLHVDFYQVNLLEKISADVPVVIVGEAPAVMRHEGELQHTLHAIKVSCLPADIPEHFSVDVGGLEAVDESIRVGQLAIPAGVEVLADPEEVVVKIAHLRVVEEEVAPEAAEEEAAEGEEGAPEGEEPSAESRPSREGGKESDST
jgi:large subunit ribosomal protein L25